ncbi:MAG: M36 family metallopeptidase [Deltaproteobacteria bacterium]|nr:M36 family metallopeptidase [Deltaproteobacteria bacterium]
MDRAQRRFGLTLKCSRTAVALAACWFLASASPVAAAKDDQGRTPRNFDARAKHNIGVRTLPAATQTQALDQLDGAVGNVAVTFDPFTGVTRTLLKRGGYLTGPATGSAQAIALRFLQDNAGLLGLSSADLGSYEVTDSVFTRATGATHLYLRQTHLGLPLYNGQLHVNINRDGRIISVNNAFLPSLASTISSIEPTVSAASAVISAAVQIGLPASSAQQHSVEAGPQRATTLSHSASTEPIVAKLMLLPIRAGEARLVWNFQLQTPDSLHWYDFNVDANTSQVWTRLDWVAEADYNVYPTPIESPIHAPILPPADGRSVQTDPNDVTASPFGWHDTDGVAGAEFTIHRGNNAHAYEDSNTSNGPPAVEPDCGASLVCDFALDLSMAPSTYREAAVTNLFYWNNVIHDIQYQYGFDEAGGNFQVNNYGNGGAGNDDVQAEAQDGGGNCNANFGTPPDGQRPRMQMFTCTNATPARDGDFDHMVIVHEYGHGISNRLVGGPSNTGCLGNTQQGGEGYSDWWGLVHTMETGDLATDARGTGTYLFGQASDGPGIRDLPYSTDPAVNDWTYESINGAGVPHGIGSRWAQAYWEVTWALIDEHGFSEDFYDADGGFGNQRAMFYFNEGLKNSICSPAFTDVRDGIVQAAEDNNGGEDACLIWEAFAAFGLGEDAISGGAGSSNPTNGFQIPDVCLCKEGETIPVADAGSNESVCLGDSVLIGTPALPGHTYLWSPGGETTAQITVSPTDTTEYTVTAMTDCAATPSDSVTVFVDTGVAGLSEDFESGAPDWSLDGLWHFAADSTCPAPELGYTSPVTSVYYGQDGTCDYNTGGANSGSLTSPPIFGIDASSELNFQYLRGVESFNGTFDVTEVTIITGSGDTTVFSLDSSDPSDPVWTDSGNISLAAFAGEVIQVRFRFATGDGTANNFLGWFIDDVIVTGNTSCVDSSSIFADGFKSGDTSAWSLTFP